jgi:glycosyltransferase involved in cell wall biosynthesis
LSLRALSKLKPEGPLRFIATNWSSDIFWFQRFPKHRAKLHALLKLADSYSTDCNWDPAPARGLGFLGKVLAVIPNAVVKETGLNIPVLAKFLLSHEQMLKLFASSKIHVCLSESDGISTPMLEAMAMGAITVQAIKTAIREWQAVAEEPANAKEDRLTWS